MRLWDFYLYPIFRGFTRESGTCVLGSDPGWYGIRFPGLFMCATNFPPTAFGTPYTSIVGSIQNPWSQGNASAWQLPADGGMFGANGGWLVHDAPFLTYGTTGGVAAKSVVGYPGVNGKLVSASYRYIGVQFTRANGADMLPIAINYTRLQTDNVTPVALGTWNIGPPDVDFNYFNMRHCAVLSNTTGGTPVDVAWSRTDVPLPVSLAFKIYGATNSADSITISADYNHATAVTGAKVNAFTGSTLDVDFHNMASQSSKAALLAATTCAYWVDTVNNKIWMKIWAGDLAFFSEPYNTENKLFRICEVTINNG
jgi:hypothetical protein